MRRPCETGWRLVNPEVAQEVPVAESRPNGANRLPAAWPKNLSEPSPGGGAVATAGLGALDLPVVFEQNVGRSSSEAKYIARKPGSSGLVYFMDGAAVFVQQSSKAGFSRDPTDRLPLEASPEDDAGRDAVVSAVVMRFGDAGAERPGDGEGATSSDLFSTVPPKDPTPVGSPHDLAVPKLATPKGESLLDSKTGYILGRALEAKEAPHFSAVRYEDAFAGIDVVFYSKGGQFAYDLELEPGADPADIDIRLEGADDLQLTSDGSLVVRAGPHTFVHTPPVLYSIGPDGERIHVEGRFFLRAPDKFGFDVGSYDPSLPLVIDPAVLHFSSYVSGASDEVIFGVTKRGTTYYFTGETFSTDLPVTPGTFASRVLSDAFVGAVFENGSLWRLTYYGGNGLDRGQDVFVSPTGSSLVCVVGGTSSNDLSFPGTSSPFGGGNDGFLACLNFGITPIQVHSGTYIGGSGFDRAHGIDGDIYGRMFVAGYTESPNFPVTAGAFQTTYGGSGDAFLYMPGPGGFSTYLGGSTADFAFDVSVYQYGTMGSDVAAFVVGNTAGAFPVTASSAQYVYGGGTSDGFVARFTASGSRTFASYLGGNAADHVLGVEHDLSGRIFVAGYTASSNFPVVGAFQGTYGGGTHDAFVARFHPDGSKVLRASYLGGSSEDRIMGISADGAGVAYVVGVTSSTNFPTAGAYDSSLGGATDAFLAKVDFVTSPSALSLSTFLGGSGIDRALAVVANPARVWL